MAERQAGQEMRGGCPAGPCSRRRRRAAFCRELCQHCPRSSVPPSPGAHRATFGRERPWLPRPGSTEGAEELLWAPARPEENAASPTSIAGNRILCSLVALLSPGFAATSGQEQTVLPVRGEGAAQSSRRATAHSMWHINFMPGDYVLGWWSGRQFPPQM